MNNIISKKNKDYINSNWNELKCSPIGPFLQMIGVAPGDAKSTTNECQSNSFSSQFNSSMTDQLKATANLSSGLNQISGTLNKFRSLAATIQQQAFKDLARIADVIFGLYIKIGNIIMVINKNLVNIMDVFKNTVNTGMALGILIVAFMNLIRKPINGLIKFTRRFCFRKNTILQLINGRNIKMCDLKIGDILSNGSKVIGVMTISNENKEYFYKIKNKISKKYIYVTGSHYIFNKNLNKYIMVKDYPNAIISNKKENEFSCILTDNHEIEIGGYTFWDYDDDLLINK